MKSQSYAYLCPIGRLELLIQGIAQFLQAAAMLLFPLTPPTATYHALLAFYFMRYLFSLVFLFFCWRPLKRTRYANDQGSSEWVRQTVAGQFSSGYWGLFYHSCLLSLAVSLSRTLSPPLPLPVFLSPSLANIYISTCWSRRANRQKMKLQTHPINHTPTATPTHRGRAGVGEWEGFGSTATAAELPLFSLFLVWQMRKQRQTTQKALRSLPSSFVCVWEGVCV